MCVCVYIPIIFYKHVKTSICTWVFACYNNYVGVQNLLKIYHSKLGVCVKLQPYDKFTVLEESHSKVPVIHHIEKKVPRIIATFACKCTPRLSASLESMHAVIDYTIDKDDSEKGCIQISSVKGSEKDINWKEKCEDCLEQFLKLICYRKLSVQLEMRNKLEELIQKEQLNPSISIELTSNHTTLCVAGYNENVENFMQEFQSIKNSELPEEKCITLDAMKFAYIYQTQIDDLKQSYPAITFTIETDNNTVVIIGKKQDRESFKQYLNKLKVANTSVTVDQQIIDYFSLTNNLMIIKRLLHKEKEQFAVFIDENKLCIVTNDKIISNKLAKYTKQMIHYVVIKSSSNVFEEHHFSKLCTQLKKEFIVDFSISSLEIEIIGEKQDVTKAELKLKEHIHKTYYQKKTIEVSYGCWRFISEKLTEQWTDIVGKCENDPDYSNVKVTIPEYAVSKPEIILEGEQLRIMTLHHEIKTLIAEHVCTNNPPLVISDQPGLFEFLTQDGKILIKEIEDSVPSCIEVTLKSSELVGINETAKEISKGTTKEGKRVILLEGNIEDSRVDVIVNPANKYLKHGGGVALALCKKGGPKIQKDSNNYITTHGELSDGAAIIRDEVGNLPCKKIIHAVGPRWKNDGKVQKVLMKTCINSLKLANGYKTIAFPAICSGIFGFPVEVSAITMIQAFCAWSKECSDVPLCDIYVVVQNHAALAFTNAIKELMNTSHNTKFDTEVTKKSYHMDNKAISDGMDIGAASKITGPIKLFRGALLTEQVQNLAIKVYICVSILLPYVTVWAKTYLFGTITEFKFITLTCRYPQ